MSLLKHVLFYCSYEQCLCVFMSVFVYCDCLLVCIVLILLNIDIEYEWYLCKAQTKQVIKNKAVTEVVDECGDNVDFEYKTQIIGEIE